MSRYDAVALGSTPISSFTFSILPMDSKSGPNFCHWLEDIFQTYAVFVLINIHYIFIFVKSCSVWCIGHGYRLRLRYIWVLFPPFPYFFFPLVGRRSLDAIYLGDSTQSPSISQFFNYLFEKWPKFISGWPKFLASGPNFCTRSYGRSKVARIWEITLHRIWEKML